MKFLEKQSPSRIIAAGFLAVILLGSWILMLPCSVRPGVDLQYIDALFTSTSAVCVTGLIAVMWEIPLLPLDRRWWRA